MNTNVNHFSTYRDSLTNIRKEEETAFIQFCKTFSSLITDSFYVWDILLKQFCYIKPDSLFLCGHSVEDAMKLKYDFYSRIIHPEDLPLWESILRIIPQYLKEQEDKREEIDYFSCTFRLLRQCSFATHPLSQMVYQRMKLVWKEGELCYLICSVRSSTTRRGGNFFLQTKEKGIYEEYDFTTKRWKHHVKISLTEREMIILMLAEQGKSIGEIASDVCKGENTIKNQIITLYTKLEVHSMQEALEVTNYYHLLYPIQDKLAHKLAPMATSCKKNRVPLTNERLQRIQQNLEIGKSIRLIAKLEDTPESTIRYWISKGKLRKM